MLSERRREKRAIRRPSREDIDHATDTEATSIGGGEHLIFRRRQASVYDVVAGHVTTTLPINFHESRRPHVGHHKPHAPGSRGDPTLAPEEVLFRRAGAPIRYAEKDIYQAHEDLPDGGRGILPDSDLLKTIHSYASRFYSDFPANKQTVRNESGEGISERSMDETALLAIGILLEEASREALGKGGDLVFTEGVVVEREHGGTQSDERDAEVFGFKDAPRYEAWGSLKRPRAERDE